MTPKPYFETCRDLYVSLAAEFYKLAAIADFESGEARAYLSRATLERCTAVRLWKLTRRQTMRLDRLQAQAELNTPEGIAKRDRIIAALEGETS